MPPTREAPGKYGHRRTRPIAAVRPRKSRPLGHQDKIPGEVVRHGFGQAEIRFLDGRVAEVRRKPPQIVMPDDRLTDREDANFRNF